MTDLAASVSERRKTGMVLFALFTAYSFDFLLHDGNLGISCVLFVTVFYAFYFGAGGDAWKPRIDFASILFGIAALLTLTYGIYENMMFKLLNVLAIPALITAHTTMTAIDRKAEKSVSQWMFRVIRQLVPESFKHVRLPFALAATILSLHKNEGNRFIYRIMFGILISVPILAIIIPLLASADSVFDRWVGQIPDWLGTVNAGEILFRTLWVIFLSIYLFGYIWGLLHAEQSAGHEPDTAKKRKPAPSWDPVTVSTVLAIINLLYLCFAIIQFSYFFGGGAGSLPDGLTYAEYARKGFAELVVVTIFNLTLMLSAGFFTGSEIKRVRLIVSCLLTGLATFSFVMLISAYLRLVMYEESYGFTVLRLLVHAFMIFLGVLFLLSLVHVWRKRMNLLKPYMIVGLAAYLVINYVNVERLTAQYNIARYEQTGKIDAYYLASLSLDAYPAIRRLSDLENRPPETQWVLERFDERLRLPRSWKSFTVSQWLAKNLAGFSRQQS